MATNMDKALYQAPKGLDQIGAEEEPIEIEIEDPESVTINAGDLTLELKKEEDEDEKKERKVKGTFSQELSRVLLYPYINRKLFY
jgi:hypothetical protein